jgi:acyl dehydratase
MEAATSEPMQIKLVTREDEMRVPFDKLEIGGRFVSRARTITETDVVNFAALTADWHPLHTNAVYAEQSMFGQRVAHGMLLLSYSIGLVPNEYVMALRRLNKVVFKRPVFFGDTIRVEGTVVNLRPLNEEAGLVTGRWRIVNQDDQTVFKLEIEAVWSNKEI